METVWLITCQRNMVKNNTTSVDTNVLLRLLLNDVPEQTKAVQKLFTIKTKYEVADVALIELVFVLERVLKMERGVVVHNLTAVIKHPQFICNKNLFEQIIPLYLAESALSINDCALLGYARLNKATPLYTFDKALIKKSNGDACTP